MFVCILDTCKFLVNCAWILLMMLMLLCKPLLCHTNFSTNDICWQRACKWRRESIRWTYRHGTAHCLHIQYVHMYITYACSSFRPLLKFSIVESKESTVGCRESGVFVRERMSLSAEPMSDWKRQHAWRLWTLPPLKTQKRHRDRAVKRPTSRVKVQVATRKREKNWTARDLMNRRCGDQVALSDHDLIMLSWCSHYHSRYRVHSDHLMCVCTWWPRYILINRWIQDLTHEFYWDSWSGVAIEVLHDTIPSISASQHAWPIAFNSPLFRSVSCFLVKLLWSISEWWKNSR
jgi:hypothetical protein